MLCHTLGLASFSVDTPIFFTSRQTALLQAALSALQAEVPDPETAIKRLTSLVKTRTLQDDP
jgi:hypothetical protein